MTRKTLTATALATLVATTIGVAGCATTQSGTVAKTQSPDVTNTPTTPTPAQADPQGKFVGSGDIILGYPGPDYFVGSADLHNTGNVGIVVRVKVSWDLIASADITAHKTVRVAAGHTRTVKFKVQAYGNQIDEYQSSPHYMDDSSFHLHASMIDTYGSVKS